MQASFLDLRHLAMEEACSRIAYPDPTICSIGFGHQDPTLKEGDEITEARCFELLREDTAEAAGIVTKMLKGTEVPQNVFGAWWSCYLNKGNQLKPCVEMWLAGDHDNSWAHFATINRNKDGKFLFGLLCRRVREIHIGRNNDYTYGNPGRTDYRYKLYRTNPHLHPNDYELVEFPKELP